MERARRRRPRRATTGARRGDRPPRRRGRHHGLGERPVRGSPTGRRGHALRFRLDASAQEWRRPACLHGPLRSRRVGATRRRHRAGRASGVKATAPRGRSMLASSSFPSPRAIAPLLARVPASHQRKPTRAAWARAPPSSSRACSTHCPPGAPPTPEMSAPAPRPWGTGRRVDVRRGSPRRVVGLARVAAYQARVREAVQEHRDSAIVAERADSDVERALPARVSRVELPHDVLHATLDTEGTGDEAGAHVAGVGCRQQGGRPLDLLVGEARVAQ